MPCKTLKVSKKTFRAVADEWGQLWTQMPEQFVTLSPVWFELWQAQFPNAGGELWTVADEGDALLLVAPLTIANSEARFCYTDDLVDYCDFVMGDVNDADVVLALVENLARAGAKKLHFKSVPDTSNTPALLEQIATENGWGCEIVPEDPAPYLVLQDTWDDYLLSLRRKDKHELKRKLKRIHNAGAVAFSQLTKAEQIEPHINRFLALHRASSDAKNAYMDATHEKFFRALIPHLAKRGMLTMNLLEFDGAQIAASLSFNAGGVSYLYNSGYDPQYADLSVGLVGHALNIQSCIGKGVKMFDFMRGGERYKYNLGATDRQVVTIKVDLG